MPDAMQALYLSLIQQGQNFRPIQAYQEGKEIAEQRENQKTVLGLRARAIDIDQQMADIRRKAEEVTAQHYADWKKIQEEEPGNKEKQLKIEGDYKVKVAEIGKSIGEKQISAENTRLQIALLEKDRMETADLVRLLNTAETDLVRYKSSPLSQTDKDSLDDMQNNVNNLRTAVAKRLTIPSQPRRQPLSAREATGMKDFTRDDDIERLKRDSTKAGYDKDLNSIRATMQQPLMVKPKYYDKNNEPVYDPTDPKANELKKNAVIQAKEYWTDAMLEIEQIKKQYDKDMEAKGVAEFNSLGVRKSLLKYRNKLNLMKAKTPGLGGFIDVTALDKLLR